MTDNTTLEPFKCEERYIVVKLKDHHPDTILQLRDRLDELAIGTTECVVVESDWHPEYEQVWAMIEARCTGGSPSTQSGVTKADDFETRFWSIVDPNGVPSDMWDALERLAQSYRQSTPLLELLKEVRPYVDAAHAGIDTPAERMALKAKLDTIIGEG